MNELNKHFRIAIDQVGEKTLQIRMMTPGGMNEKSEILEAVLKEFTDGQADFSNLENLAVLFPNHALSFVALCMLLSAGEYTVTSAPDSVMWSSQGGHWILIQMEKVSVPV